MICSAPTFGPAVSTDRPEPDLWAPQIRPEWFGGLTAPR